MKKCDVLILGAGISGLSAGYFLSKSNLKVTIIEKKNRIGTKPCAGGLTIKSVRFLKRLIKPDIHLSLKENKNVSVYLKEKKINTFRSPFPYYVISRERLDNILFQKIKDSNIEILFNEKISSIDLNRKTLRTENGLNICYKVLIGADGVFSVIRRKLGERSSPASLANTASALISDKYFVDVVDDMEFYFGENKNGYKWLFNGGDFYSVGCGGREDVPALNGKLKDFIAGKTLFRDFKIYNHPIPVNNRCCFGKRNVLLLGDAAGLAGGLYGEGIFNALMSSFMAANTINMFSDTKRDFDNVSDDYRKNMKIALGNTLFVENLIAQVYYKSMEITKGYILSPLMKTFSLPILYTGHKKIGIPGINKNLVDVF